MSSHHIVKEGQEPALIICDPISYSVVAPLLEWAPMVVVTPPALEEVLTWGIKIDVVLAPHHQSESLEMRLLEQSPIKILPYLPTDDPLAVALSFLIEKKQKAVHILAELEDAVFILSQKFTPLLQIVLLNEHQRWSAITSGHLEKWLPANSRLWLKKSIEPQEIQATGIVRKESFWEAGNDGIITVKSTLPFWLGEAL